MPLPRLRTLRYARAWLNGARRFEEEDVTLERGDQRIPATLTRPAGTAGPLPAWIVLHGLTRRGRAHAQLQRFTRALVESGAVAIVPDVPEWRALDLAPRFTVPTLRAAIAGLRDSGWARDARVGVIGFSFGAPHAIVATADPEVANDVAGSVAFGAYCSLARTIRFFMTGTHDWQGRSYHAHPDAYGRWVFAANYLTSVSDHTQASDVASALRSLAHLAGDLGLPSIDARLDPSIASLRETVAEERRALFDLFAPASGALPDPKRALLVAEALVAVARTSDPFDDPRRALEPVVRPVHVLHGRNDVVIPFTEGLRLRATLPAHTWSRVTVTRLFGHSGEQSFGAALRSARELPRFLRGLRGVLRLV